MRPSPRSLKYFDALCREGDKFNYAAWLKRVREEDARDRGDSNGVGERRADPISVDISVRQIGQLAGNVRSNLSHVGPCRPAAPDLRVRDPKPEPRSTERNLLKVCKACDKFLASRRRDAVYGYLRSVYSIVTSYRMRKRLDRLIRRACRFAQLPEGSTADPFATIIRCTCRGRLDQKTVSKMARALRYADHRQRPVRLFVRFMKRVGGINGCAENYASMRRELAT
jgi:hypothetical protein